MFAYTIEIEINNYTYKYTNIQRFIHHKPSYGTRRYSNMTNWEHDSHSESNYFQFRLPLFQFILFLLFSLSLCPFLFLFFFYFLYILCILSRFNFSKYFQIENGREINLLRGSLENRGKVYIKEALFFNIPCMPCLSCLHVITCTMWYVFDPRMHILLWLHIVDWE